MLGYESGAGFETNLLIWGCFCGEQGSVSQKFSGLRVAAFPQKKESVALYAKVREEDPGDRVPY